MLDEYGNLVTLSRGPRGPRGEVGDPDTKLYLVFS